MKTEAEIRTGLVTWRNIANLPLPEDPEIRDEIETVKRDALWWSKALEWVLGEGE